MWKDVEGKTDKMDEREERKGWMGVRGGSKKGGGRGRKNGWMDEWLVGWMDGWMDGWSKGRMETNCPKTTIWISFETCPPAPSSNRSSTQKWEHPPFLIKHWLDEEEEDAVEESNEIGRLPTPPPCCSLTSTALCPSLCPALSPGLYLASWPVSPT